MKDIRAAPSLSNIAPCGKKKNCKDRVCKDPAHCPDWKAYCKKYLKKGDG